MSASGVYSVESNPVHERRNGKERIGKEREGKEREEERTEIRAATAHKLGGLH